MALPRDADKEGQDRKLETKKKLETGSHNRNRNWYPKREPVSGLRKESYVEREGGSQNGYRKRFPKQEPEPGSARPEKLAHFRPKSGSQNGPKVGSRFGYQKWFPKREPIQRPAEALFRFVSMDRYSRQRSLTTQPPRQEDPRSKQSHTR